MRDAPSQKEMSDATNPQTGAPNYVDKSANNTFYLNRGDGNPAYRYWEYR